jgi:RNA 3'-terminal phosphate cyclase (ATP)
MITLDGAMGEGGGQVLRTALSLSLVTGQPIELERIRAGRQKPGLARQHLTCVQAAAAVGDAVVQGAELGSQHLRFEPRGVRAGDHAFAIGTAGSTTLVLQTLLPALLVAAAPSTLRLSGGTHNPLAPSFDFLAKCFAPALRAMGVSLDLQLVRHGFAPAGGGIITATIGPGRPQPIEFRQREAVGLPRARVLLSKVAASVGERELHVLRRRLDLHPEQVQLEVVDAHGPGNMVLLELPNRFVTEVVGVPGERGTSAEQVAEQVCAAARRFLASDAPVGEHLADQLLLPMAMAGAGAFRTLEPTLHTRTNAQVIERFLPVRFRFEPDGVAWLVEVRGRT